jgi:hypothetical protein
MENDLSPHHLSLLSFLTTYDQSQIVTLLRRQFDLER